MKDGKYMEIFLRFERDYFDMNYLKRTNFQSYLDRGEMFAKRVLLRSNRKECSLVLIKKPLQIMECYCDSCLVHICNKKEFLFKKKCFYCGREFTSIKEKYYKKGVWNDVTVKTPDFNTFNKEINKFESITGSLPRGV